MIRPILFASEPSKLLARLCYATHTSSHPRWFRRWVSVLRTPQHGMLVGHAFAIPQQLSSSRSDRVKRIPFWAFGRRDRPHNALSTVHQGCGLTRACSRSPSAREIVGILMRSYAARLGGG